MKNLILILFLSLPAFANQLGYEACDIEEGERKRCEVTMVAGQKEGKEICRALDNSDVILIEAQFSKGKLNGPLVCKDFSNQIYLKANYRDGKLNGEHRDYSKGRHWRDIKEAWLVKYFDNDKQVGMEFFADSKDKILEILPHCWESGETGSNYAFCLSMNFGSFDEAVKKHLSAEVKKRFKEMNRDIENKHQNGKVSFKAKMVDGQYDGEATWYYETGILKSKIQYNKGKQEKAEEFFESGKVKSVKLFKDRLLQKEENFYENGKLSSLIVETQVDGFKKEKIEQFDDQGFRTSEMTRVFRYSNYWGELDGPYRAYSDKGVLYYEGHYKMGKLNGKVTVNYREEKEEELWENGVRKNLIIFDKKSGKPKEKVEYFDDGSEKSRTKLDAPTI